MQSFSECVLPHFTGAYKYLLRGMAREGLKCTLSRMTASDASTWENAMKGGIVVQNVLSRLLSFQLSHVGVAHKVKVADEPARLFAAPK